MYKPQPPSNDRDQEILVNIADFLGLLLPLKEENIKACLKIKDIRHEYVDSLIALARLVGGQPSSIYSNMPIVKQAIAENRLVLEKESADNALTGKKLDSSQWQVFVKLCPTLTAHLSDKKTTDFDSIKNLIKEHWNDSPRFDTEMLRLLDSQQVINPYTGKPNTLLHTIAITLGISFAEIPEFQKAYQVAKIYYNERYEAYIALVVDAFMRDETNQAEHAPKITQRTTSNNGTSLSTGRVVTYSEPFRSWLIQKIPSSISSLTRNDLRNSFLRVITASLPIFNESGTLSKTPYDLLKTIEVPEEDITTFLSVKPDTARRSAAYTAPVNTARTFG